MSSFRIKNLTPFPCGTKLTSTRPPQPEMVLIVRGRFELVPDGVVVPPEAPEGLDVIVQGPLTGDVFAEDDSEGTGELLYPSDMADFKPRAEVMLSGSCHAPRGHPMIQCPVSFQVGLWQKAFWVYGHRTWQEGLLGSKPSDPHPFTQMPIGYSRAFGGAGIAANPVGLGVDGWELPNVESAESMIRSRRDRPPPAGFGPLNPSWPQRLQKRGTSYGASYLRERAPYYAADFDWTYFNAAPADQHLDSYLVGDEELRLQNLHPDHPLLITRLPGLRIRCFVNDVDARFREVPMHLDTLFVDGDSAQVLLTWRGRTEVADTEFEDVTSALVASEPLQDRPLGLDHYRCILEKFEEDPLELDQILGPEEAALFKAHARGDRLAMADALVALLERESPGIGDKVAESGKDLREEVAKGGEPAPPPVPLPVAPRVSLNIDPLQMEVMISKVRETHPDKADWIESKLADPRLKAIDPNYRPPGSPALSQDRPGPGADLSGRDLTGQDLAGLDLSGAKLEGAILSKANLRGTNLSRANLQGTMLFMADLTEADLSGVDLTRANAASACLDGAELRGATLEQTYFGEAKLRGARLDQVRGSSCFFTQADLSGARLHGAHLTGADLEDACLEGADFRGATLDRCLLHRCRGSGLMMVGTLLDGCSFEEGDFTGASFETAIGSLTIWTRATLDRADFGYSRFTESHFTEVSAKGSRFACADLQESRFFKSVLDGADFSSSKLKSADLCKCVMNLTSFADANLYDAKLLGAVGQGTDFSGANLKRSLRPA